MPPDNMLSGGCSKLPRNSGVRAEIRHFPSALHLGAAWLLSKSRPEKNSMLAHPAFVKVRPTDVLADIRRQIVQETLGADFVAYSADLADVMLHAAYDGKTVHDHSPLLSMGEVSHTPPDSSLSGAWQVISENAARLGEWVFCQEGLFAKRPENGFDSCLRCWSKAA